MAIHRRNSKTSRLRTGCYWDDWGFEDYFLIVWDYVRYAREHDILVGPGRGSAAGSVVAYLLGITGLDPLQYDLLFERFLNPERVSMPDIDIDFCYEKTGRKPSTM